jgi:cysteine desulfurase
MKSVATNRDSGDAMTIMEDVIISTPIYLDGFSTMPLAPEAKAAMIAALELPGNAASPHAGGERAGQIVEQARGEVAALIGAAVPEIVFTSGATEANNLAILGSARASEDPERRRIVVSAVEHKAVLAPAEALRFEGFELVLAPVDHHGRLDLAAFATLVDERTLLASVMAVNNETGVIQPVAEAAAIAHRAGARFHCDAAQAAGKIPLDVQQLEIDYLSLSAHKLYGPMGIGALYISAAAPRPRPLQFGGGQQAGQRPGTEPVALIAGFGAAARVARDQLESDALHGAALVDAALLALSERQLRFTRITGQHRVVPGSVALAIEGIDAEALCMRLARTVHLSTGSACTSGQLRMSHVLEAMGFSGDDAASVIRLFWNRYSAKAEVYPAADAICTAALQSRLAYWKGSPVATGHETDRGPN